MVQAATPPNTPVSSSAGSSAAQLAQKVNAGAAPTPQTGAAGPALRKPGSRFNWRMIVGGFILLVLVVGAAAGFYLSQRNQEIRQQAYVGDTGGAGNCTSVGQTPAPDKPCCSGETNPSTGQCQAATTGPGTPNCPGTSGGFCQLSGQGCGIGYESAGVGGCSSGYSACCEKAPLVCTPSAIEPDQGCDSKMRRCLADGSGWVCTTPGGGIDTNPDTGEQTGGGGTPTGGGTTINCYNINKDCSAVQVAVLCSSRDNLYGSKRKCECIRDGGSWDNDPTVAAGGRCVQNNACYYFTGGTSCDYKSDCSGLDLQDSHKFQDEDQCLRTACETNGGQFNAQNNTCTTGCPTGTTDVKEYVGSQLTLTACRCQNDTSKTIAVGSATDAGCKVGSSLTCAQKGGDLSVQCASTQEEVSASDLAVSQSGYKCCVAKTTGGSGEAVGGTPGGTGSRGGTDTTLSCSTVAACTTWNCPNGDTDGNGQCTLADQGASYTVDESGNCSQPASGCGQIDFYNQWPPATTDDWNNFYCGHSFINFQGCGGGGGGGTQTEQYGCNTSCQTNAQCRDTSKGGHPSLSCDTSRGKCRLTSNPDSATCRTAVAGPQCLNITMNVAADASNPPEIGDQINFTCGTVVGADHYVFRVMAPDGTVTELAATEVGSANSLGYTVAAAGEYKAQCQICTAPDASSCQVWEPWTLSGESAATNPTSINSTSTNSTSTNSTTTNTSTNTTTTSGNTKQQILDWAQTNLTKAQYNALKTYFNNGGTVSGLLSSPAVPDNVKNILRNYLSKTNTGTSGGGNTDNLYIFNPYNGGTSTNK